MVDDEGVDLVFHRRYSSATLAVQVKARMSDSKRVESGGFMAFVWAQTSKSPVRGTCSSWRSTSSAARS